MRDNFSPHTQNQCIKFDSLGQGNKEFSDGEAEKRENKNRDKPKT